jgi:hypothetical protein
MEPCGDYAVNLKALFKTPETKKPKATKTKATKTKATKPNKTKSAAKTFAKIHTIQVGGGCWW